ncbi:MAG: hypothetical protein U0175_28815 [Caldilineaceae bacterium]
MEVQTYPPCMVLSGVLWVRSQPAAYSHASKACWLGALVLIVGGLCMLPVKATLTTARLAQPQGASHG